MPSKRSPRPPRLRDGHPPHGLWLIGILQQGLTDGGPVRTGKRREVRRRHPVNAGRPFVGLHPLPCACEIRRVHNPLHEIIVQGWLRATTPLIDSPGRAQRRERVTHGSSLSFRVRPFTGCPPRTPRLLRPRLTSVRSRQRLLPDALRLPAACCLVRSRRPAAFRRAQAWSTRSLNGKLSKQVLRRQVEQTSPNKDMDFRCTTAAFTLSPAPAGLRHLVLTRPGTEPSMRFLSVSSHFCTRASFRQLLARPPLPSASSYICPEGHYRYSYRGLSPHKSMPMSGVHKALQRTFDRAALSLPQKHAAVKRS